MISQSFQRLFQRLRICESNPGDDTQEKLDAEEAKWPA